MDKYTADTNPFEEDALPAWMLQQEADAARAEAQALENAKTLYKEGDQVGNFLFVRYMRYKNRAVFACPDCGKKFQYNIYTIKNKKRCKWYKGHQQLAKKGEK
jgi:hypothetical protein